MKAYSIDLRQKIIDADSRREGSYRQLAVRFCVSLSFVQTLLGRYQDTGKIEPLPHGGGKQAKFNQDDLEIVQQLVAEHGGCHIS